MPSSGSIRVRAYTSKAEIPAENITVSIERRVNGGWELLSVQKTDRSGLTQPVEVPTPDTAMSTAQDMGQGWTELSVFADSPLYERIQADNVQVFPGIMTMQNLEMIPHAELPEQWSEVQRFTTTPQTL